MSEEHTVHGLVDHLFRREAGRMIAILTRSLGPSHLSLAEEVVQEAMIQALKRWPFHGVPQNPAAWLHRVARNLAVDHLRRDASFRDKEGPIRRLVEERSPPGSSSAHGIRASLAGELDDDSLRLIFLCCHPALSRDSRVALTLKTVAGFGVDEIARAFLQTRTTIAQRLVRAKQRIRKLELPFEMPPPDQLSERLETVLEGLYLMFNEGYASRSGDVLLREDLCREALRLVRELTRNRITDRPDVHALAALLHFQAARLPARQNASGQLMRLAEQDRTLWDEALIYRAFAHLERAAVGHTESTYHLQAAIAAEHTVEDAKHTDWPRILKLYDRLMDAFPSPVVELNRAVALAEVRGPAAALTVLEELAAAGTLGDYYLLPATRAEMQSRLNAVEDALASYQSALDCPCSEPERRFLNRRLHDLRAQKREAEA